MALVQVGWVLRLLLPDDVDMVGFAVLVLAELAVPLWAERTAHTAWHPGHIAERYGLFTLIVLGESVLAATLAVEAAIDADAALLDVVTVTLGGMLTAFAMWWLYFSKDAARFLTSLRAGFVWGYGHYLIFGSAAAVGAGLAVNVDHTIGDAHVSRTVAAAAFCVPVALFLVAVWLLHWAPHHLGRSHHWLAPGFAAAVLLASWTPWPVLLTGLLVAGLAGVGTVLPALTARPEPTAD